MAAPENKPSLEAVIGEAIRAKRDGHTRNQSEWEAMADDLLRDIARPRPRRGGVPGQRRLRSNRPDSWKRASSSPPSPRLRQRPAHAQSQRRRPSGQVDSGVAAQQFSPGTEGPARGGSSRDHLEATQRTRPAKPWTAGCIDLPCCTARPATPVSFGPPSIASMRSSAEPCSELGVAGRLRHYHTQSQSSGALIEMVTFSFQLASPTKIKASSARPPTASGRIFDFGLRFQVNRRHNQRRQVLLADFEIDSEFGVSARWRADYNAGIIRLESRNLEPPGQLPAYLVSPVASIRSSWTSSGT